MITAFAQAKLSVAGKLRYLHDAIVSARQSVVWRSRGMIARASSHARRLFSRQLLVGVCMVLAMAAPEVALRARPIVGAYVAAVSFVALLVVALRLEWARKLAISAAILPMILLITLCLPQADAFAQAGVLYSALLLLALLYGYLFTLDEPVEASSLGRRYGMVLPVMIVIGEALGALGFGMIRHHYEFRGAALPLVAAAAVVYAAAEEVYFRGLIQQQAAKLMPSLAAGGVTAVVYAFASLGFGSMLPAVFALIAGVVLSGVYYIKPNILLTTTINASMKLTYIGLVATFVLH